MFKYTFTGDFSINTPFCTNLQDIKKDFKQTPDYISNKSTYPNGFEIELIQYADKTQVITNKELTQNSDGSFSVKL